MNTFQDLARRVDSVAAPIVDVDGLIAQGEQRLHRRRMLAVLAAVAVAVVAMILAGGYVTGSAHHQSIGPVNKPKEPGNHHQVSGSVSRKIVYYDAATDAAGLTGAVTVHYGDQVVDVGDDPSWFTVMDVTDDGFVYPTGDDRLWFSDGGRPEQIGSHVCSDGPGFAGLQVMTANEGSLVTWFDCSGPAQADLVVFDTGLGRELVRRPMTGCGLSTASFPGGCNPDAIIGDHVYFGRTWFREGGQVASSSLDFDVATGRVMAAQSYAMEVRSHARGLVIGDSWESGTPTGGIGQPFWVDGSRLVPVDRLWAKAPVPSAAFDTLTQRPVRLHLPPGYEADHDELGRGDFWLFEWLDDDTVALVGRTGWDDVPGYGDILTCRLSTGRCELAVPGHGPVRVTANGGHPG